MSGILTKAIGDGIGLVKEYNAHREQSKDKGEQHAHPAADSKLQEGLLPLDNAEEDEVAEDEWALDDMQHDQPKDVKASIGEAKSVDQLLATFRSLHPPPPPPSARPAPISMPVILPQRRPRHRDRGFVRAYAPKLEKAGIDQAAFFDFLDGFERAIWLRPVFHAVNIAVAGAVKAAEIAAGPSLTLTAAALAIHIAVEGSRRGLILYETNKYLDGMNEVLYKSRGLYAVNMMFKPDSNQPLEEVDPSTTPAEAVGKRADGHGGKFSRSSGKTHGELAIPDAAPLVFPQFDAMPADKQESKMKDAGHFFQEYSDKRARAKYDYSNPESKLSVPGDGFASVYSDPTSPTVRGGVAGLLTGGRRPGLRYRLAQRRGKDPRAC